MVLRRFLVIAFLVSTPATLWGINGFSIGLTGSFEADVFKYATKYGKIGFFNARISGSQNFFNDMNGVATVDQVLVDLDGSNNTPQVGTPGTAIFQNYAQSLFNEAGPDGYIKKVNGFPGFIAFAFGSAIKIVRNFYMIRMGFSYDVYGNIENSFIFNDNYFTYPEVVSQNAAGLSSQQTIDLILLKAREGGVAILPSTGGQDILVSQKFTGRRIEIPVSLAIVFLNTPETTGYIGGGISWFYGTTTRVLDDSLPNTVADIDRFTGFTLGYHFLIGGEYRLWKGLTLSAEMFVNFGQTGPLSDSVISTNPYTASSFFHTLKDNDSPGPEDPDNPRKSILEFNGTRVMVGINYYFTNNI